MADFINTIDVLGDDAVFDSIINRTITEFKDDKVTSIRTYSLYGCSNLETVDLPNVTSAGKNAFSECKSLVNVSLPSLKTSNNQLFQNCTSLESVSLPEYTGALNYTFMGCSALKNVDFPKATEVGNTFLGGSAVTHLCLPSVKKAGNNAFRECAKLKYVDLPVCTQLEAYALYNLLNLETLILRSSTVCSVADSTTLSLPNGPYPSLKIYVPSALVDPYKVENNLTAYANQFRKLEEWTVDGTVTGALDIENRHMVRFFNDDGTLLGYKVVTTGGSATYDGTPVKPGVDNPSDYEFIGFEPVATNVTEDVDCYATYKEPFNFSSATWAEIASICEAGEAANTFKIGDTKDIVFNGTETITMEIVGFNHDVLKDGSGNAGISLICKTLPSISYKDTGSSNFHSTLSYKLLPMLPNDLQSVVKSVKKDFDNTNSSGTSATPITYNVSVWIPSATELNVVPNNSVGESNLPKFMSTLGSTYEKYANTACLATKYGSAKWLTRTKWRNGNYNMVYSDGSNFAFGVTSATFETYRLPIGFCI